MNEEALAPEVESAIQRMLHLQELKARVLRASPGDDEFSFGGFPDQYSADVLALDLLSQLSGGTVNQVREVLRRAEFWLAATTTLDCGATAFRKADEALHRAFGREVAQRQG